MQALSNTRKILGLLFWLALCFATAALGAWASLDAPEFYGQLTQPDWAPPAWLFGPAWTTLYTLMAISAWLVWQRGGFAPNRGALGLFMAQLALNGLWSWLFFAWHLGAAAFADIIVLWILIALTIAAFWRRSPLSGVLLLPYLGWVSFAGALNYAVWQLNPGLLGA